MMLQPQPLVQGEKEKGSSLQAFAEHRTVEACQSMMNNIMMQTASTIALLAFLALTAQAETR